MNRKTPALDFGPAGVAPLDLMRPASEQIFAALKDAILDTSLKPGQMISENEVGLAFGASRTPVREAFGQLREAGLLITRPSRGTYVSKLSEHQIRSVQFLREGLEVAIVERLCEAGIPDAQTAALKDALTQQRVTSQANDKIGFQTQDDLFHAALADATGFQRLSPLLVREKAVLDRLRVLSLNDHSQMPQLLAEHQAIFEAILNKQTAEAVVHMRHHLRQVLKTLSGLIAANRDFFD